MIRTSGHPTKEETILEREELRIFIIELEKRGHIAKLLEAQEAGNDTGEYDGLIGIDGVKKRIEVRRKGYPNHSNKRSSFAGGWKNKLILNGVILNEITLKKHIKNNAAFVLIVNIFDSNTNTSETRYANITVKEAIEYLKQPEWKVKSTNTGIEQSVKIIPFNKFKKFK